MTKKSPNQNKNQRINPRHQGNKSEGLIHISEFQALQFNICSLFHTFFPGQTEHFYSATSLRVGFAEHFQ